MLNRTNRKPNYSNRTTRTELPEPAGLVKGAKIIVIKITRLSSKTVYRLFQPSFNKQFYRIVGKQINLTENNKKSKNTGEIILNFCEVSKRES